jgi:Tfp pilus assembly protein PilO
MKLVKRVVTEKRSWILPLGIALALNAAIYVFVVYPLSLSVQNAAIRADEAAQKENLSKIRQMQAATTVSSKNKATDALKRFYDNILPANLTGARRITYLRLAQLAERADLTYQRGSVREEQDEGSRLARLRLSMVLAGSYADVRRFIYQLETAPEFVVIEHVALAQGQERSSPLVLNLEVSTYYRTGGDGT